MTSRPSRPASYRRLSGIAADAGKAVPVQRMVFGNVGGKFGAGVGCTHDAATGARAFNFTLQFNGQGEDLVAGRHKLCDNLRLPLMLPAVWTQLNAICHELEALFAGAQDAEFTVPSGAICLQ